MTDLQRFGLMLIGFAASVFASGIVMGLIGRYIVSGRHPK